MEIFDKSSINIAEGNSNYGDIGYYAKNIYTPTEGASKLSTDENGFAIYDGNTLINYVGEATEITIPDHITEICSSAFFDYSELTSVTIPDNVTSIGEDSFYDCSGLTSVTIPDNVTNIGGAAFWGCSALTSVTIGNSVINIDSYAFYDCYRLVEVYNKSSLNITAGGYGYGAVGSCAKNVYTPTNGESKLSTDENGFIIYDGNTLVYYVGEATEIIISDSVTSIGEYAFYGCSGLTSVTIPNSVTYIGNYAFEGCTGLTSVTIPNSVTYIGYSAFYGCSGLTSVTIGNSVNYIGESAFYSCDGLTSVYYKGTKTDISSDNWSLTSATRYYYSETEPALNSDGTAYDDNYWHYDTDGVTPVIWKK